MIRRPFAAVMALALLLPPGAAAQDLASGYEQIGTVTITADGSETTYVVTRDLSGNSAMAEARVIMGRMNLNVVGQTVNAEGVPGSPLVQVTVMAQPDGSGATFLSAEIFDQGFDMPILMDGEIGQAEMSDFVFDGARLSLKLAGQAQRAKGYAAGEPTATDDPPLSVEIALDTEIPTKQ